jgi:hypothetical protein
VTQTGAEDMTATEKMTDKLSGLSIATLKDMVIKLNTDMREGTDIVLSFALDALMARMPEPDFVSFCEGLE